MEKDVYVQWAGCLHARLELGWSLSANHSREFPYSQSLHTVLSSRLDLDQLLL